MKLSETFNFPYGHRLLNNHGKCFSLHGHSIRLEVSISGNVDEESGIVLDSREFRRIVEKEIVEVLSFSYILQAKDPLLKYLEKFEEEALDDVGKVLWRVVGVPFTPTRENVCRWVYKQLVTKFKPDFIVEKVRLWEDEDSSVEVIE